MMSAVRNPSNHHPRARAQHIEELRLPRPPRFVFRAQNSKPLFTVFRVAFHEFQSRLLFRQWRSTHIYAQHIAEPQVFAHTLMYHLFLNAAAAGISVARAAMHIFITEFAPRADNLDSLCFVGVHHKVVNHRRASRIFLTASSAIGNQHKSGPGMLARRKKEGGQIALPISLSNCKVTYRLQLSLTMFTSVTFR